MAPNAQGESADPVAGSVMSVCFQYDLGKAMTGSETTWFLKINEGKHCILGCCTTLVPTVF